MFPEEFLLTAKKTWRPVPDSILSECDENEREYVRTLETQGALLEFEALSDIILNCHNRFQFAKTYKVLRADLANALSQPENPQLPLHVSRALKQVVENTVRQKLLDMAGWFFIHFADASDRRQVAQAGHRIETAIEIYAGKEGSDAGPTGCIGGFLLCLCIGVPSIWLSTLGVITALRHM